MSSQTYVRAWPKCIEAYVVGPHVYQASVLPVLLVRGTFFMDSDNESNRTRSDKHSLQVEVVLALAECHLWHVLSRVATCTSSTRCSAADPTAKEEARPADIRPGRHKYIVLLARSRKCYCINTPASIAIAEDNLNASTCILSSSTCVLQAS